MELYPFKFIPILKEVIWGGKKLKNYYNKQTSSNSIGESWELSSVNGNISVVLNGKLKGTLLTEILKTNAIEIMGKHIAAKFGTEFPLLIKLIDARENLSVQVHPNDDLARKRHNSFGKTEMWYILQNEPEAKLVSGLKKEISKEEYIHRIKNNAIEDILAYYPVTPGEVFFIPAGLVHAIGAGILLAEVQQTSNITYRIYDYNRKDKDGNTRQLHTQESVDAVNFTAKGAPVTSFKIREGVKRLVACEYFTVQMIDLNVAKEYNNEDFKEIDSFIILICLDGNATINYKYGMEKIIKGENILIPAALRNSVSIIGNAKLLEAYI
ncbi:MAG: class I mannose-6-phosphate isomerase [Endomicrobium sp.]|jgi:mannose-6-phosphate isomerase|nr:class I mannose-6-phosphate isomerase [Endomicrobium sp.]